MKLKLFLITIISAVTCLALPIQAVADNISWSTEEYTAYVHGEEYDGIQGPFVTMTGPPLPVTAADSASFGPGLGWDLDSTITSSSMNINMEVSGIVVADASASFIGTYAADSNNPFFNFTYSLTTYTSDPWAGNSYWISVDDLTDVTNLYSGGLSSSGDSVSIFVPTAAGHEIVVDFGISQSLTMSCCPKNSNAAMSYSMTTAVVPEPISSNLFIIGGATLGFRRFRKKRR